MTTTPEQGLEMVWVLGAGQYSDWHIVGVFATREAAEETRQRMILTAGDEPTDPQAFPLNRIPMVRAYTALGHVTRDEVSVTPDNIHTGFQRSDEPYTQVGVARSARHPNPMLWIEAAGPTPDIALKAARDLAYRVQTEFDVELARLSEEL